MRHVGNAELTPADVPSRGAEVDLCHLALRLLADTADTFTTDIPLSKEGEWPRPVVAAARRISTKSRGRPGEDAGYRETGEVSAKDSDAWDAFVAFAPYAYDASVWGIDGTLLADVSNERSLSAHLEPHERSDLARTVGQERVVPMGQ